MNRACGYNCKNSASARSYHGSCGVSSGTSLAGSTGGATSAAASGFGCREFLYASSSFARMIAMPCLRETCNPPCSSSSSETSCAGSPGLSGGIRIPGNTVRNTARQYSSRSTRKSWRPAMVVKSRFFGGSFRPPPAGRAPGRVVSELSILAIMLRVLFNVSHPPPCDTRRAVAGAGGG